MKPRRPQRAVAIVAGAAALAATGVAPASAQQVKFASIWEQPADNAALDDWYRRTHSREAIQFVGPWLTNYIAYRGYDVPAEADRFNTVRYRLTEMWYPNPASRVEAQKAWLPLTPPPVDRANFPNKTRIETIWVSALPSETWLATLPKERETYLRWVFFMRYPPGVPLAEGEHWFISVHAPQIAEADGVRRFVCSKSVDPITSDRAWVRMCEVWFDDYAAWRAMALAEPPPHAAPPWAKSAPYLEYVSIFAAQRPDMDFLHDSYRQP